MHVTTMQSEGEDGS